MLVAPRIHELDESLRAEHGPQEGSKLLVNEVKGMLGITKDKNGRMTVKDAFIRPEEISVKELAEGLLGKQYLRDLEMKGTARTHRDLMEAGPGGGWVDSSFYTQFTAFNQL